MSHVIARLCEAIPWYRRDCFVEDSSQWHNSYRVAICIIKNGFWQDEQDWQDRNIRSKIPCILYIRQNSCSQKSINWNVSSDVRKKLRLWSISVRLANEWKSQLVTSLLDIEARPALSFCGKFRDAAGLRWRQKSFCPAQNYSCEHSGCRPVREISSRSRYPFA